MNWVSGIASRLKDGQRPNIFLSGSRRNETFIQFVKFYNRVQSLPRLTLLSRNEECNSVARDELILGVFIALVAGIFCVDVAGRKLSDVVWEAGKDDEMAEGADIIGWIDEPAKSWSENLKKIYNILRAGFQWQVIQNRSKQKSKPFNRQSPESGK